MSSRATRPPRMTALAVVLLATLGSAGLLGCGAQPQEQKAKVEVPKQLPELQAAVLHVETTLWPTTVRTQGSLIADEVTIIGAKVAGRVNQVSVDLGDAVRASFEVATLDQDDFRLEVALAEAQLLQSRAALGLSPSDPIERLNPMNAPPVREAKAVWDETQARVARVRQLQQNSRNTVTQEELDQAVAAEGAAEARHAAAINAVREKIALINVRSSELNLAKQRLTDTAIHAPFDGLVRERHVAPGSFVQIGDPIVTLVRASILRFRGTIPERHASRLAMGQQVRLKIEGVAEPRIAQVTRISPVVDEMSRSLAFEAQVSNGDGSLRTGLFAEAEVMVDPNARAIVVPRTAVIDFAGTEKVWKVVDGMAKEQIVQTARHAENVVEIRQGLVAGEEILAQAALGQVARIVPIYENVPVASKADMELTEVLSGEEESLEGEDLQLSAPAGAR